MKRSGALKRSKGLRRISHRRRLEIDLDRRARTACLVAAGGRCERCGTSDGNLEHHHVFTRRVRVLRWRLENALALCPSCHRWWHASRKRAIEWFVEKFGQARLELLRRILRGRA